jgi:hypothetical protein
LYSLSELVSKVRRDMPSNDILRPGDLAAEEMIRLHDELGGGPASSSHHEAWQRWHGWIAELLNTDDEAQRARAQRIAAYIDATFEPPERSSTTKVVGIAGIAGAGGAAGYEVGQETTGADAATGSAAAAAGPVSPAGRAGAPPATNGHGTDAGHGTHAGDGTYAGQAVDSVTRRARGPAGSLGRGAWWIGGVVAVIAAVVIGVVVGMRSSPPARGIGIGPPIPSKKASSTKPLRTPAPRTKSLATTSSSTKAASTTAPATSHGSTLSAYTCAGGDFELYTNNNVGGVLGGGKAPTFSTGGRVYCLVEVATYHWNNGRGAPGGTLLLTGGSGPGVRRIGPLRVRTTAGEAPNVNWVASLATTQPVVIDGNYTVSDSQPATWSQNPQSRGFGFVEVWVAKATPR